MVVCAAFERGLATAAQHGSGKRNFAVRFAPSLFIAALAAGCGASTAQQPLTAIAAQGTPQAFPLELAGEARVGWVIASHDASRVSVSWVLNPGFAMESGSMCAQTSAFGWVDPALCERRVDVTMDGTPTVFASFESLGGARCGEPVFLQVQANVVEEPSGAPFGSAYAGTFKGRIALVPACADAPPAKGCTRNAADWLAQGEWPLSVIEMAGLAYSEYDLRELLETDAQSDASVFAANALVLAQLNVAAGAQPASGVESAMVGGAAWLEKHGEGSRVPFGMKVTAEGVANPEGWDDGVNLAAVLGRFNEGFAGSPRCE
jgi:hypothetical protein